MAFSDHLLTHPCIKFVKRFQLLFQVNAKYGCHFFRLTGFTAVFKFSLKTNIVFIEEEPSS